MVRTHRKIPEILTPEEQDMLLKRPNRRYPTGLRNLCMIRLMLNLGLRSAEVLSLKVRDLDWISGKLMVKNGKGGKDRTLWLSEEDLELLKSWRDRKPESPYLFTTLEGGQVKGRYLREMVKRLAKQAGIDKDVHPHMLRHTFATDLYRQSKNIRLVQKALGHSDLSTTMIYTHIIDEELEDALRSLRQIDSEPRG